MKKSFIEKIINEGNVWTRKYHYHTELWPAGRLAIYRSVIDAYGYDVPGTKERIMMIDDFITDENTGINIDD